MASPIWGGMVTMQHYQALLSNSWVLVFGKFCLRVRNSRMGQKLSKARLLPQALD